MKETVENIQNMETAKYSLLILEYSRDRYEAVKEIGTKLQKTRSKVEEINSNPMTDISEKSDLINEIRRVGDLVHDLEWGIPKKTSR